MVSGKVGAAAEVGAKLVVMVGPVLVAQADSADAEAAKQGAVG